MSDLQLILSNALFNKILLAAITALATLIAKYLKDLSISMSKISNDMHSLNKEMAIIVERVQSHEKRLDYIETGLNRSIDDCGSCGFKRLKD